MTISHVYLQRDDAIKFIKKSYRPGVAHFVRGGATLYTKLPGECEDGHARGYEMTCLICVSQKDALKYVRDMIGDVFAEKGVRIQIGISDLEYGARGGCIFIG